jgi:hypothetical protein
MLREHSRSRRRQGSRAGDFNRLDYVTQASSPVADRNFPFVYWYLSPVTAELIAVLAVALAVRL